MKQALIALVAVAALAAVVSSLRASVPQQVDVPFVTPTGDFHVMISVGGGPPTRVVFDTGSTGLRILAPRVGPHVMRTATVLHYGYADGTLYDGVKAYAVIRIGPVATATSVPFQLVENVHCQSSKPTCKPGNHISTTLAAGRFGVMGVRMTGGVTGSPLAFLPAPLNAGFVVTRKTLYLGLPESAKRTFKTVKLLPSSPSLPNGVRAWNNNLGVTWRIDGHSVSSSPVETLFDTGTGNMLMGLPNGAVAPASLQNGRLRSGIAVEAAIPGVFDWKTTSGTHAGTNWVYVGQMKQRPYINTGWAGFDQFDVMYDPVDGLMGFRRPAATP